MNSTSTKRKAADANNIDNSNAVNSKSSSSSSRTRTTTTSLSPPAAAAPSVVQTTIHSNNNYNSNDKKKKKKRKTTTTQEEKGNDTSSSAHAGAATAGTVTTEAATTAAAAAAAATRSPTIPKKRRKTDAVVAQSSLVTATTTITTTTANSSFDNTSENKNNNESVNVQAIVAQLPNSYETIWFALCFGDTKRDEYKVEVARDPAESNEILIDTFKKTVLQSFSSSTLKGMDAGSLQVYSGINNEKRLGGSFAWNSTEHGGNRARPLIVKVTLPPLQLIHTPNDEDLSFAKERGRQFINSIMQKYNEIRNSDGMRVLFNVVKLDREGMIDVVLRKVTVPFWTNVIQATEKGFRICAMGSPGIGKTTTTCILIRLLLKQFKKKKQDALIIYHFRGGSVYKFAFSSDTEKTDVNVVSEASFNCLVNQINLKSTYYVVDPANSLLGCDPPIAFIGKVVIVASPNSNHWGGHKFTTRDVRARFRIFPVWSLGELLAAKEYFSLKLQYEEIKNRYELVGGIPRHIFYSPEDFSLVVDEQKRAIRSLTQDQVQYMLSEKYSAVDAKHTSQPKSFIMVYSDSGPMFDKFNPQPITGSLCDNLYLKFGRIIWNQMIIQGTGPGTTGWLPFECYCRYWFVGLIGTENGSFLSKQFLYKTRSSWTPLVQAQKPFLGECLDIDKTGKELFSAAGERENVLFYSSNPSQKFIDSLYRKGNIFYGIQTTSGISHTFSPVDMDKFVQLAKSFTEMGEFHLYYLVTPSKLENFQLTLLGESSEREAVLSKPTTNTWIVHAIAVERPPIVET